MPKFTGTWRADTDDPIVVDTEIAGGYQVVANEQERLNIEFKRRKVGMVVYQQDSGVFHKMISVGNSGVALQNVNFNDLKIPGLAGPQGATGLKGSTGTAGISGSPGPTGQPGPPGSQGQQGPPGLTGQTGPQGATGTPGILGGQGVPGPQGATGPQGPRGATGATGPQGGTGADGPPGPLGPQGPAGPVSDRLWFQTTSYSGTADTSVHQAHTIFEVPTLKIGNGTVNNLTHTSTTPGPLMANSDQLREMIRIDYAGRNDGLLNAVRGCISFKGGNTANYGEQGFVLFDPVSDNISYYQFTGCHICELSIESEFNQEFYNFGHLLSVISTKKIQGPDNLVYICEPTTKKNQKSVMGILANTIAENDGYHRIMAVGDGYILVNSQGGNIEIGDFICSSDEPGIGMKQEEEIVKNYTVARSCEQVIWENEQEQKKLINCVYIAG